MTERTKSETVGPSLPNAEEFTQALGQVARLMSLSEAHKDRPMSELNATVAAPLMLKQLRVYTKGKQPLAAVTWAYASSEIKSLLSAGNYAMKLNDWRSGPEIVVVDCVSPFERGSKFVDLFLSEARASKN